MKGFGSIGVLFLKTDPSLKLIGRIQPVPSVFFFLWEGMVAGCFQVFKLRKHFNIVLVCAARKLLRFDNADQIYEDSRRFHFQDMCKSKPLFPPNSVFCNIGAPFA